MFLNIFELRMENKTKQFGKNCFDNVVKNWFQNDIMCPTHGFKKSAFSIFFFFYFFALPCTYTAI